MCVILDERMQTYYSLTGIELVENTATNLLPKTTYNASANRILEVHCDLTEPYHKTDEIHHTNDHVICLMCPDKEKKYNTRTTVDRHLLFD